MASSPIEGVYLLEEVPGGLLRTLVKRCDKPRSTGTPVISPMPWVRLNSPILFRKTTGWPRRQVQRVPPHWSVGRRSPRQPCVDQRKKTTHWSFARVASAGPERWPWVNALRSCPGQGRSDTRYVRKSSRSSSRHRPQSLFSARTDCRLTSIRGQFKVPALLQELRPPADPITLLKVLGGHKSTWSIAGKSRGLIPRRNADLTPGEPGTGRPHHRGVAPYRTSLCGVPSRSIPGSMWTAWDRRPRLRQACRDVRIAASRRFLNRSYHRPDKAAGGSATVASRLSSPISGAVVGSMEHDRFVAVHYPRGGMPVPLLKMDMTGRSGLRRC